MGGVTLSIQPASWRLAGRGADSQTVVITDVVYPIQRKDINIFKSFAVSKQ